MDIALAIALARLLEPVGGLVAAALGFVAGRPTLLVVAALLGAAASELLLAGTAERYTFNVPSLLIGVAAMLVWAGVGYAAARFLRARRR